MDSVFGTRHNLVPPVFHESSILSENIDQDNLIFSPETPNRSNRVRSPSCEGSPYTPSLHTSHVLESIPDPANACQSERQSTAAQYVKPPPKHTASNEAQETIGSKKSKSKRRRAALEEEENDLEIILQKQDERYKLRLEMKERGRLERFKLRMELEREKLKMKREMEQKRLEMEQRRMAFAFANQADINSSCPEISEDLEFKNSNIL